MHYLLRKIMAIYHSLPVISHTSTGPSKHFSRADLIHGPHRQYFLNFSSPDDKHPWSKRWQVIEHLAIRLYEVLHDKYTQKLLINQKWRQGQNNPFVVGSVVYCKDLYSSGRGDKPAHHGFATIDRFLPSEDNQQRNCVIVYRRATSKKWHYLKRHLSSLVLLTNPQDHVNGLCIFELFLKCDEIKALSENNHNGHDDNDQLSQHDCNYESNDNINSTVQDEAGRQPVQQLWRRLQPGASHLRTIGAPPPTRRKRARSEPGISSSRPSTRPRRPSSVPPTGRPSRSSTPPGAVEVTSLEQEADGARSPPPPAPTGSSRAASPDAGQQGHQQAEAIACCQQHLAIT